MPKGAITLNTGDGFLTEHVQVAETVAPYVAGRSRGLGDGMGVEEGATGAAVSESLRRTLKTDPFTI